VFILDTNVFSELRHGKPNQSPEVRRWAAERHFMGKVQAFKFVSYEATLLK